MKRFFISLIVLFFSFLNVKANEEFYSNQTIEENDEYKIYIDEGLKYLELEDYETAKSFFWKALDEDPKNLDSYINLAIIHIKENNLERAMELLKKVEELMDENYPKKEIFYYNYGLCYFLNSDYKNAIEYLQNALNIYPDFGEALYYLSKSFDALGDGNGALINISKARAIFAKKNQIDYYQKADELFYILKDKYRKSSYDIANELINEADRLIDNNLFLAISLLEEAISFNPDIASPYYKLASIYIKEGSLIRGLELLETAHKLQPDDINVSLSLGEIYVKFKKYEDALDIFNKALVKDKNNPRTLYDLGFLYSELGKENKAKEYFSKANSLTKEEIFSLLKEKVEPKKIQIPPPIQKKEFKSFYTTTPSPYKNKGILQKGFYIGEPSVNKQVNRFQKTTDY